MSKGLGKIYLKHNAKFHKRNFTVAIGGERGDTRSIPRYYIEKIFTEEERRVLRQENLSRKVQLSKEERRLVRDKKKEEAKKLIHELRTKNEIMKRSVQKKNSKGKEQSKNY